MLNYSIDKLKIAFAGAGGTGKSTIAQALRDYYVSRECKINYLPSQISNIGKQMGLNHYNAFHPNQCAFQWSILFAQIEKERALFDNGYGYITDRCSLDYIANAIQKIEEKKLNGSLMSYYFQIAREHAKMYDLIVFIPVEFENTESDKKLNNWKERDNEKRKRTNDIIYGELVKNNVSYLQVSGSVNNRMQQIQECLYSRFNIGL